MPTALARTPAPTYRMSDISSRPWIVPSSPHGPCSSGKTTSTSPSVLGTWSGSLITSSRFAPNSTGSAVTSTSGSLPSVIDSRSGSPLSSTQWPLVLMPTGTTSYLSRSIACSTLAAVTQEMACSLDRPPNTTATQGLRFCSLEYSLTGSTVAVRRSGSDQGSVKSSSDRGQ